MNIKAFKKACFDLVKEYNAAREKNPAIEGTLVKDEDNALWIRFTTIGSLLDYCEKNETESVLAFCLRDLVVTMLIFDAARGDD